AQLQRLAAATLTVVAAPAPGPQPVAPAAPSTVAPSPATSTPAVVTPPAPPPPSKVAVGMYELPKTVRNSIGMEFVLIPAGTFQMGSNDGDGGEKPVHTVHITKSFYLGKYEVTQEQWQAVMGKNPSDHKGDPALPVENVSWDDVHEFIAQLNARERGTA